MSKEQKLAQRRITGALAAVPAEDRLRIIEESLSALKDVEILRSAYEGCLESQKQRQAIPSLPKLLIKAKMVIQKLESSGETPFLPHGAAGNEVEASSFVANEAERTAFGGAPTKAMVALLRESMAILAPNP